MPWGKLQKNLITFMFPLLLVSISPTRVQFILLVNLLQNISSTLFNFHFFISLESKLADDQNTVGCVEKRTSGFSQDFVRYLSYSSIT